MVTVDIQVLKNLSYNFYFVIILNHINDLEKEIFLMLAYEILPPH
jgi:hypothetical protein